MDSNKIATKLLTTGVSLAAGWVATKAIGAGWKAITGEDAPSSSEAQEDENVSLVKVVVFSVITAGVSSLINATTARAINRAMGQSNAENDEVAAQKKADKASKRSKAQQLGAAEV